MAMQKYQPRALTPQRMMRDFERLVEDFFGESPSIWQRAPEEGMGWAPNIELFDKEDKVVVRAELPGIKKDDISISVSGDVLTITGERKSEKEVKEESYYRGEMSYGKFARSVALPGSVDANKIDAVYENGILEISMPKTEAAKPKKIEIKVKK